MPTVYIELIEVGRARRSDGVLPEQTTKPEIRWA